jgi:PAS domain-containing protein
VDVNKTTLRLFGANNKQELIDNTHLIFKDDAANSILASMVAIAEGRKSFEGQGINYDLMGRPLHFRISWNIPGDSEEDMKRVIVAMQDTTSLEKIRKELEEREAIFRCVFERASEGMMLLDERGKILLVNEAMEALSGVAATDIVGKMMRDYYTAFSKISILRTTSKTPKSLRSSLARLLRRTKRWNITSSMLVTNSMPSAYPGAHRERKGDSFCRAGYRSQPCPAHGSSDFCVASDIPRGKY